MASGTSLMHWLDPLPSNIVNFLAELFLDLQLSKLKTPKEAFDKIQKIVEQHLGTHHLVSDKLALKLSFELRRCVSYKDASWFIEQRLDRTGQEHFESILNLALLQEMNPADSAALLLKIANKERDSVKQLLAVVLICKNHQKNRDFERSRSVYDKIEDLVTRVSTVKSCASLNDRRRYIYVMACEELAFLHMIHGQEKSRIATLRKALNILDIDKDKLDWSMQIETLLIRALKSSSKREEVTKQCGHLLSRIMEALTHGTDEHFLLKYGKYVRGAYMEVIGSLKINENRSLTDIGERLYGKLKNILGNSHHEVVWVAAQLASLYFHLGKRKVCEDYIKIAEASADLLDEEVQAVLLAKVRTTTILGKLYHAMKRPEVAEAYYMEELRLNSKIYGDRSHFVANSLHTMASLYREQGKTTEAIICLQECLEMIRDCKPKSIARHKEIEKQIEKLNVIRDKLC